MPRYHIPMEKRSALDLSKYPDGFECGKNYVIQGRATHPELEEYRYEIDIDTAPEPRAAKNKAKTAKAKPKKEATKTAKRGRK